MYLQKQKQFGLLVIYSSLTTHRAHLVYRVVQKKSSVQVPSYSDLDASWLWYVFEKPRRPQFFSCAHSNSLNNAVKVTPSTWGSLTVPLRHVFHSLALHTPTRGCSTAQLWDESLTGCAFSKKCLTGSRCGEGDSAHHSCGVSRRPSPLIRNRAPFPPSLLFCIYTMLCCSVNLRTGQGQMHLLTFIILTIWCKSLTLLKTC